MVCRDRMIVYKFTPPLRVQDNATYNLPITCRQVLTMPVPPRQTQVSTATAVHMNKKRRQPRKVTYTHKPKDA